MDSNSFPPLMGLLFWVPTSFTHLTEGFQTNFPHNPIASPMGIVLAQGMNCFSAVIFFSEIVSKDGFSRASGCPSARPVQLLRAEWWRVCRHMCTHIVCSRSKGCHSTSCRKFQLVRALESHPLWELPSSANGRCISQMTKVSILNQRQERICQSKY